MLQMNLKLNKMMIKKLKIKIKKTRKVKKHQMRKKKKIKRQMNLNVNAKYNAINKDVDVQHHVEMLTLIKNIVQYWMKLFL